MRWFALWSEAMANSWLKNDAANEAYLRKSIVKSEQQKMLERLLLDRRLSPKRIADIACGAGTLTYHVRKLYPDAGYVLVDVAESAIKLAKEYNGDSVRCEIGDIFALNLESDSFDLVFCWQTLSWLDDAEVPLRELVRITRSGGHIFASSLFNLAHDVDVYAKVFDRTLESGRRGDPYNYNTYSAYTIGKWLNGRVSSFALHEFIPEVDFVYDGRGVGTYTVPALGKRLQISAGTLMNWGILEIIK